MSPPTKTSVMLVSGEYFDHLAPDPGPITYDVLEHGLAVPRFNNQTVRPITVLEHSMRVRRIALELAKTDEDQIESEARAMFDGGAGASWASSPHTWGTLPPNARENWRRRARQEGATGVELWALLHDAHEALVPWSDCLRPGKTDEMREVEGEVDAAIRCALVVPLPTAAEFGLVRTADAIALYFEAMLWQPGAIDWAPVIMDTFWGVELDRVGNSAVTKVGLVERFMPLIAPRPGECWRTEVEASTGGVS